MFGAVTGNGVSGRARDKGLYRIELWNPRDFAVNNYRTVDDRPYGGGPGMVMMAEPLAKSIVAARDRQKSAGVPEARVVYLTPQGRLFGPRTVVEPAAGSCCLPGDTKGWMNG